MKNIYKYEHIHFSMLDILITLPINLVENKKVLFKYKHYTAISQVDFGTSII